MKKISQILIFLLAGVFLFLPFHAFFVTSINHFFLDAGTPAPVFVKMWKEITLLIIFIIIGYFSLVGASIHKKTSDTKSVKGGELFGFNKLILRFVNFLKRLDVLDILIISFTLLALIVSVLHFPENSLKNIIYGLKYTIFPLWVFFIFRRIPLEISEKFFRNFWRIFPFFSGALIFSGIVFFLLAQNTPEFFQFFGYSREDSFYSLFQPLTYCQKISFTDICRAQGVFSGPNQMGAYLIFLVSTVGGFCICRFSSGLDVCNTSLQKIQKFLFWVLFFSGIFLLFFTFSRSTWIGGIFSGIFFLIFFTEISNKTKQKILAGIVIIPVFLISVFSVFLPEISDKILNRVSSSSQHYGLSLEAAKSVIQNPIGQGLGKAGPASKYESEKGKAEVGIVPENWYLQIGIETGILGILFWILIVFLVIQKLVQKNIYKKNVETNCNSSLPLSLASAIFGISIMGIFLHSWESSAVAYTVWGLAGIILRKR